MEGHSEQKEVENIVLPVKICIVQKKWRTFWLKVVKLRIRNFSRTPFSFHDENLSAKSDFMVYEFHWLRNTTEALRCKYSQHRRRVIVLKHHIRVVQGRKLKCECSTWILRWNKKITDIVITHLERPESTLYKENKKWCPQGCMVLLAGHPAH